MPLIRLISVPYAHFDGISLSRGSRSARWTYGDEECYQADDEDSDYVCAVGAQDLRVWSLK